MPFHSDKLHRVPKVPLIITAAVFAGFLATSTAGADDPIPDLSGLSFTDAFDSLCSHYSKYYAFSDWKGIDWPALHNLYAPEVQQAEATADTGRFKLAIKRFASSFPDGHVRVRGNLMGLYEAEIGGGYGLTLIQLSDARIAVNRVVAGGTASAAGIEIGAIINRWNGMPVESVLDDADIVWEGNPPATSEGVRMAQLRRLVRAPIGNAVEVIFTNPDQDPVTTTLTAADDSLETWELSRYTAFDIDGNAVITQDQILESVRYEILPSGIGYLRCNILVEFDEYGNVTGGIDNIVASLHDAVSAFNAASVSGIVVDIRDNPGGFDRLAAIFGGLFYDRTEVYEHASFYDEATGQFEGVPQFTLYLEPQASYFGGTVVCLISAGTASSAEGVAMAIQRLPQGHVMGFYGTHGSFGLVGGESLLPAGIGMQFTLGRSLDSSFGIQIDTAHDMMGGIAPDRRIPLTVETVQRKFGGNVDVELEQAEAFLVSLTPVYLSAFEVERLEAGAVLTWEVSQQCEETSFHVWRNTIGTVRVQLSSEPITGARVFRFVDPEAPAGEITYWLQEIGEDGRTTWLGSVLLSAVGTSLPGHVLHPSRPSPIKSVALIPFDINEAAHVTLTVYDVRGRVVRTLQDERLNTQSYVVEWDGRNDGGNQVASGVYFCKLVVGEFQDVRKLTLLR